MLGKRSGTVPRLEEVLAFTGDQSISETLAAQKPAKAADSRLLSMTYIFSFFSHGVDPRTGGLIRWMSRQFVA
jgi:hypothetical protein